MTTVDISICVAVYRRHSPPNLTTLSDRLSAILGRYSGELVVALNGISSQAAGVPKGARTVRFPENQGVPIAWNAAAAAAEGRLVCIANDDLDLGDGALALLADALDAHANAGVVGPVGTQWDMDTVVHREYVDTSSLRPGEVTDCDVLSGFLLMTPASVFAELGGFDEALTPCGYEEVDYCTAVRRSGRQVLIVAGVPVEHRFGISAKRPWRRIAYRGRSERLGSIAERNHRYVARKWGAR